MDLASFQKIDFTGAFDPAAAKLLATWSISLKKVRAV
jgi:hypothetical protein